MTQDLLDRSRRQHTRTDVALVVLIAALVLALIVAAIAVAVVMARAGALGPLMAGSGGGHVALAVCFVLIVVGMGGLTAAVTRDRELPQRHD